MVSKPNEGKSIGPYVPEVQENNLPFLKIPNGYPPNDEVRTVLSPEKEPSEEDLERFFSDPTVLSRVIYCPSMRIDETDDWGRFGNAPGYLFVMKSQYKGLRSFNDEWFFTGKSNQKHITATIDVGGTPVNVELLTLPDNDFISRDKFATQRIMAQNSPRTFAFLERVAGYPNPQDFKERRR